MNPYFLRNCVILRHFEVVVQVGIWLNFQINFLSFLVINVWVFGFFYNPFYPFGLIMTEKLVNWSTMHSVTNDPELP